MHPITRKIMSKVVTQPSIGAVGQKHTEWQTFEKSEKKRYTLVLSCVIGLTVCRRCLRLLRLFFLNFQVLATHGFVVVYRLTSVYSNPEFQFVFRLVSYCKVFFDRFNETKCHTSDPASVFVTIPFGKPRCHHVRVTDCLHLPGRTSNPLTVDMTRHMIRYGKAWYYTTSHTPHHTTPHHTHTTPHSLHHTTPHCIALYFTTPHYATPTTVHHTTSHCTTLHHTTLHGVVCVVCVAYTTPH